VAGVVASRPLRLRLVARAVKARLLRPRAVARVMVAWAVASRLVRPRAVASRPWLRLVARVVVAWVVARPPRLRVVVLLWEVARLRPRVVARMVARVAASRQRLWVLCRCRPRSRCRSGRPRRRALPTQARRQGQHHQQQWVAALGTQHRARQQRRSPRMRCDAV
jgi:hypothetical protein